MDKKTERIVRRHYQSETHRSQARKIPRSAYEKNNTASHTPTIVNRYADSLAHHILFVFLLFFVTLVLNLLTANTNTYSILWRYFVFHNVIFRFQ